MAETEDIGGAEVACVCCGQAAKAELLEVDLPVGLMQQITEYRECHEETTSGFIQNAVMYYLKLKEAETEHLAAQAKADEDDKPWD